MAKGAVNILSRLNEHQDLISEALLDGNDRFNGV